MNLFEHVQRTTGTQLLALLEVSCSLFADTIMLASVNQAEPIISNGNTYICYPFDFTLPQDGNSVSSQMQLVIGNAGNDITGDLEKWQPGYPVKAKLLLADPSSPDTIFKTFPVPISDISLTQSTVTATCGNSKFMQQKTSKLRYDQYFAPGLF